MEDNKKPPRSKVARQSWETTYHDLRGSYGSQQREILLKNYVTGKQLEAGLDIVKILEKAFVKGGDGLSYKQLREACMGRGHTKRTIEESLRKLRREGICGNTTRWKDKKIRRKGLRRRKSRHKTPRKRASMAGTWGISWNSYASMHDNFSKKGLEFEQELKKLKLKQRDEDG